MKAIIPGNNTAPFKVYSFQAKLGCSQEEDSNNWQGPNPMQNAKEKKGF